MEKYDPVKIKAAGYVQGEKNVLYEKPEFKMRIVNFEPGSEIPSCIMSSYVIFIYLEGKTEILINGNKVDLAAGELIASEPAIFTMRVEREPGFWEFRSGRSRSEPGRF